MSLPLPPPSPLLVQEGEQDKPLLLQDNGGYSPLLDKEGVGGGLLDKEGVGGGLLDKEGVGGGLLDKEGVGGGPLDKEGVGGGPLDKVSGGRSGIYNHPILKQRRQTLRNQATPAEKLLWKRLQHSQLDGYKFRRQHSVGPYILDFFCPEVRLAIELDGDSHFTDDAMVYDAERTEYLNSLNIRVLRFLNSDVYDHLDAVCEKILSEVTMMSKSPPPSPLLIQEGEQGKPHPLQDNGGYSPLLDKEGVGGGHHGETT